MAPLPAGDSPTLAEGTTLAHYSIRSVLGAGGMGTVYLAEDTALERPVAVKVLNHEVAGDAAFTDRFVREARAAASVSHPNLTHVYFVGTSEGRPFFAMEYCPGTTLEEIARRESPVPLERGIRLLAQAARGLAAAHGAGVVHRDVKPGNLLVLPDGTVKVADFGLAKSLAADVVATAGRIMGTPTYMSPEQVRGRPVDARTDVYLLGLTAWCLFAGRPPFASEQVGELIHDQMNTPLPDLEGPRPDLPPALGELLSRMCEKDPAKRPASMEEVARRLEGMLPRQLNPGSLVARGFAASVDMALFAMLLAAGVGVFLGLRLLLQGEQVGQVGGAALEAMDAGGTVDLLLSVLAGLASAAVLLLSQFGLEAWTGRTLGKWMLNLQVVREDGNRPAAAALLLRFLLRYPMVALFLVPDSLPAARAVLAGVQALAVGAGVVTFFFSSGRTLSDRLTGTRVVYRFDRQGPAPPAEPRAGRS